MHRLKSNIFCSPLVHYSMVMLLLTTKHLRVVFANMGDPAAAMGSPSVTSSFSL